MSRNKVTIHSKKAVSGFTTTADLRALLAKGGQLDDEAILYLKGQGVAMPKGSYEAGRLKELKATSKQSKPEVKAMLKQDFKVPHIRPRGGNGSVGARCCG